MLSGVMPNARMNCSVIGDGVERCLSSTSAIIASRFASTYSPRVYVAHAASIATGDGAELSLSNGSFVVGDPRLEEPRVIVSS